MAVSGLLAALAIGWMNVDCRLLMVEVAGGGAWDRLINQCPIQPRVDVTTTVLVLVLVIEGWIMFCFTVRTRCRRVHNATIRFSLAFMGSLVAIEIASVTGSTS